MVTQCRAGLATSHYEPAIYGCKKWRHSAAINASFHPSRGVARLHNRHCSGNHHIGHTPAITPHCAICRHVRSAGHAHCCCADYRAVMWQWPENVLMEIVVLTARHHFWTNPRFSGSSDIAADVVCGNQISPLASAGWKLRPNPLMSRYRDGMSGDAVITLPRSGYNIL